MPSASGLGPGQRLRARDRAVQAAMLALHHAPLHYSQEATPRWEGIKKQLNSRIGKYPKVADCSSFVTWCLWNALHLQFGLGDIVNGSGWNGGYTGTMLSHGLPVQYATNLLRGDCVHYGSGLTAHVAMVVTKPGGGVPRVASWGSEGGPRLTDYNYRTDNIQFRRYI